MSIDGPNHLGNEVSTLARGVEFKGESFFRAKMAVLQDDV